MTICICGNDDICEQLRFVDNHNLAPMSGWGQSPCPGGDSPLVMAHVSGRGQSPRTSNVWMGTVPWITCPGGDSPLVLTLVPKSGDSPHVWAGTVPWPT